MRADGTPDTYFLEPGQNIPNMIIDSLEINAPFKRKILVKHHRLKPSNVFITTETSLPFP